MGSTHPPPHTAVEPPPQIPPHLTPARPRRLRPVPPAAPQVHYLSDSERGTVWEETIIYCPKNIQILALSATVGNPADLQGWISRVHGPTEVVTSSWRPVPLTFMYARRPVRDSDLPEWCAHSQPTQPTSLLYVPPCFGHPALSNSRSRSRRSTLVAPLLNKRRDSLSRALVPRRDAPIEMSKSLRYTTPSIGEVVEALRARCVALCSRRAPSVSLVPRPSCPVRPSCCMGGDRE